MRRDRSRVILYLAGGALGGALAAALFVSLLFFGMGGKLNVIETPSMATYSPVGTLVLTMPVEYEALEAGDAILFNVAGGEEAYFHRVVSIEEGGVSTQGDLNGAIDPWLVAPSDVLGREVFKAAGLGFMLRMLPALVIGLAFLYLLTFFYFPAYWKPPVWIFGVTLLASVMNYLYRPFVDVAVLSQVVVDGTATTRFVPTGLWQLEAHAFGGTSDWNVHPGELGVVESSALNSDDQFSVTIQPYMEPWVWAVLSAIWVLPFLLTVAYFLYARARGLDLVPKEEPVFDDADVPPGAAGKGHTWRMELVDMDNLPIT